MIDGLIGSQHRGVPCRVLQAGKLKSKFLRIPGQDTWLSNKLVLVTSNTQISKLLRRIVKGIQVQNVNCYDRAVDIEIFLKDSLRVAKKTLARYGTTEEAQALVVSKFCSSIRPCLALCCNDRFLMSILMFCASEIAVLIDLFPDFSSRFSFEQQIKLLENSSKIHPDNWISSIKYHTAYPMAYLMDPTNLPPRPDCFVGSPWIWTGHVKRFLKNKMNSTNLMASTLGFALLQGVKRGCATVPDSFLLKEIKGHVVAMTTPPTHVPHSVLIDSYTGEEFTSFVDRDGYLKASDSYSLQSIVVNLVDETFLSTTSSFFSTPCTPFVIEMHEPSHNSCFEKTREEGGAYMEIVESLNLQLVESPPIYCKGKVATNTSYQLPNMQLLLDQCKLKLNDKIQSKELCKQFEEMLDPEFVAKYQNILMDTSVVALPEPLKVRIITKSEALPSFLCIALQKTMKKYINRFPSLVLTTRPLRPKDFRDVWARLNKLEVKISQYQSGFRFNFNQHVSGDYKAATDKLNINFTTQIFEKFLVCMSVPEEDRPVYRQVLYAQRLRYPKRYSGDLKKDPKLSHLDVTPETEFFSVDQMNGQLMGSILSFPVLCLANLICYKRALEEYINLDRQPHQRRLMVSAFELPVLVNGDDIYFQTNDRFYEIWLKYINIAGFVLSVGKNYVHRNTFTINSQCFRYNSECDKLTECTYLNVGLLIGQSKGGDTGEILPIWDLYNKLLKGSHNKTDTHRRFLHYHSDNLRSVSHKGFFSLFLPKVLGGLGFVRPSRDVKSQVTHHQASLALYLHNRIVSLTEPTIGSLDVGNITLVDTNKPKFLLPYEGEPIYQSYKIGDSLLNEDGEEVLVGFGNPIPAGFHDPLDKSEVDTPDPFMIHTLENLSTPKLKYRSISSSVWKAMKIQKPYFGNHDFIGLQAAMDGRYPWRVAQKIESDLVSFEENLNHLVVREVASDFIGSIISGLMPPVNIQEDPQDLLLCLYK
nr:MAG: putative RNA-dependent RNA polymerase [Narnaviridae sp.]